MNNALNWILALTTFMFGIFFSKGKAGFDALDSIVFLGSRLLFAVLLTMLIVHKVWLVKYESAKGLYLETLRTHLIELKFNVHLLKANMPELTSVTEFINAFRYGYFIARPNDDGRPKEMRRLDRVMQKSGRVLKATFTVAICCFILYFLCALLLMSENKN